MNKVTLIGHLGQDPELKKTSSNTSVMLIKIATDEGYMDKKTNSWVNATEWHRVQLWNKAAERAQEQLMKGDLVVVTGKIKTRSYDKDGQTSYITEIVADHYKRLTKRQNQNS